LLRVILIACERARVLHAERPLSAQHARGEGRVARSRRASSMASLSAMGWVPSVAETRVCYAGFAKVEAHGWSSRNWCSKRCQMLQCMPGKNCLKARESSAADSIIEADGLILSRDRLKGQCGQCSAVKDPADMPATSFSTACASAPRQWTGWAEGIAPAHPAMTMCSPSILQPRALR